jgi:hypothetical protein
MATWTYSDWVTQTVDSTRLTRLRLHIQEVSENILGAKTRNGAFFPPDQGYLDSLMGKEKTLSASVNVASSPTFAQSRALCRRSGT